ncbi:Alpha-tubulin N-acetyltransferase 1 [Perkinsus olseni]|uniref:Alpha-tubulin N-acetyltransferase 1 n=1 Tax=Perkinsus olseni TaxID=32597 RepID=A0A7J6MVG7_PEROL|nr:Alpha-tubulin N-acetyltransferase 1 [Perkinsus olseni]
MKTDFDCYEALGVAWSKRSYQIVLLDSDRVRSLYSTEAQNARQRYKQVRELSSVNNLRKAISRSEFKNISSS